VAPADPALQAVKTQPIYQSLFSKFSATLIHTFPTLPFIDSLKAHINSVFFRIQNCTPPAVKLSAHPC